MKNTAHSPPEVPEALPRLPRKRRRGVIRWFFRIVALCIVVAGLYLWWTYHGVASPVEIYRGVTYSCERVPDGPESGGLLHLIRADLNVPGVGIYITPLDADAVKHGWQYRLKYVSTAVKENNLAAAVNGTFFDCDSTVLRMAGDLSRSIETTVVDHTVSHLYLHVYLLWWDDDLTAHLEMTKPPSPAVLARAKWGIGAGSVALFNGQVNLSGSGHNVDHRTMIAADPVKRIIWLAVFDKASQAYAAQSLADHGEVYGVTVDGGTSSAMAIGRDAYGVQPGTAVGNWRPVANQFGIRALPR